MLRALLRLHDHPGLNVLWSNTGECPTPRTKITSKFTTGAPPMPLLGGVGHNNDRGIKETKYLIIIVWKFVHHQKYWPDFIYEVDWKRGPKPSVLTVNDILPGLLSGPSFFSSCSVSVSGHGG